jgi:hypothetical protein
MLLISGVDPALTEQVCHGLSQRNIAHCRVDPGHATAEHGNLFQAALDARATGLVVLEPLAWRGSPPPAQGGDELLGAALSAARAPGVSSLLLVTQRPDGDGGLRRLRRDGVPYVVLRPAPLFHMLPLDVERSLAARRVLIPAEVATSVEDAMPVSALVDAMAAAIGGSTPQGSTLDLPAGAERSLAEALSRAGAIPQLVQGWRSRVGRWFGQASARLEGAHIVIDGVAARDDAAAVAPAPAKPATAIAEGT